MTGESVELLPLQRDKLGHVELLSALDGANPFAGARVGDRRSRLAVGLWSEKFGVKFPAGDQRMRG